MNGNSLTMIYAFYSSIDPLLNKCQLMYITFNKWQIMSRSKKLRTNRREKLLREIEIDYPSLPSTRA